MSAELQELGLKEGTVLLDVRPILRAGKEPFGAIMQALENLQPGQGLAVRAIFEAKPLLGVLGQRGLRASIRQLGDEDWIVEGQPPAATGLEIDVRGLEPPEPLARVMAAVQALSPGATLKVVHERRPQFLYPRLEEEGLIHRTEEAGPGLFHIYVTRPGKAACGCGEP